MSNSNMSNSNIESDSNIECLFKTPYVGDSITYDLNRNTTFQQLFEFVTNVVQPALNVEGSIQLVEHIGCKNNEENPPLNVRLTDTLNSKYENKSSIAFYVRKIIT